MVTRKKESWLGVVLTALVCGVFLWWWFLPPPISSETERDPLYWIGLAREAVGSTEPTLSQRLDVIMIAEALRQHGAMEAARKVEADWLPDAWRNVPSDLATAVAAEDSPAPPESMTAVRSRIDEAAAAFDMLEIERGQAVLRDAVQEAGALPAADAALARWWLAARQARSGLAADAVETRRVIDAAATVATFPDWLVAELFEGDIAAPVVASLAARPAAGPEATALAQRWRALVKRRLTERDHPAFVHDGPAADASRPPADPATPSLWAAVEANRLTEARRLAGNDPSAQLAVARLLAWLAAPPT